VWVVLRAILGLYPGYGLNAVDELRRQSYATLGVIAAPLVRQLVKWSLKKARLWGSWMTTNSR
jgi:hypothetical protein